MRSATALLVLVGSLLASRDARAHIDLLFPETRVMFQQEAYPCGTKMMRGAKVTAFRPGETVVVKWNVSVEHTMPGHFRIAIDDSGQDFPVPPNDTSALPFVLSFDASGVRVIEQEITLPNIQCTNCTLQLSQQTAQRPPFDESSYYYQCADITVGGEPTGAGATSSASSTTATSSASGTTGSSSADSSTASGASTGGSGSTTGGSAGGGNNNGAPPDESGGCSLARSGDRGSAWSAIFLVPLLAWRRRRVRPLGA